MEKRTVLAIVLSALVLFGFQAINFYLNPVANEETPVTSDVQVNIPAEIEETKSVLLTSFDSEYKIEDINLKTELFDVTFSTKGANITSLKLLEHKVDVNSDENVDLVLNEINNNSLLNISLGDYTDPIFDEVFSYKKLSDLSYEFSKTFTVNDENGNPSSPLTLIKTYNFLPNDYMFELIISLKNSENQIIPINNNGKLYALNVGKQIGPNFKKLDRRDDYRKISVFTNGKRKELKVKKNETTFSEQYSWAAIEGKFFTLAVIPENNTPAVHYTNEYDGDKPKSELSLNRNSLNGCAN